MRSSSIETLVGSCDAFSSGSTMTRPLCIFCDILEMGPSERAWHDRVLIDGEQFTVIAGLGAQSEGYVLIVPRVHVTAFGELAPAQLGLLRGVVGALRAALAPRYGACVVFEHGSCGVRGSAGGCIDHAHLHVLPTSLPIHELAHEERVFEPLPAFEALRDFAGEPYLFLQDQDGNMGIADGHGAPGQYFRRLVARADDGRCDWDYGAFPKYEVVRATIAGIAPLVRGIFA